MVPAAQDHFHVRLQLLELPKGFVPIHARHGEIQEDQGDLSGRPPEGLQRLQPIPGFEDRVADALQHLGGGGADHGFVVDHQDGA